MTFLHREMKRHARGWCSTSNRGYVALLVSTFCDAEVRQGTPWRAALGFHLRPSAVDNAHIGKCNDRERTLLGHLQSNCLRTSPRPTPNNASATSKGSEPMCAPSVDDARHETKAPSPACGIRESLRGTRPGPTRGRRGPRHRDRPPVSSRQGHRAGSFGELGRNLRAIVGNQLPGTGRTTEGGYAGGCFTLTERFALNECVDDNESTRCNWKPSSSVFPRP